MATDSGMSELGRKFLRGEIEPLKRRINPRRLRRYVREYARIPSRHMLHSGNSYAVEMLCDELEQINQNLQVRRIPFTHETNTLHNVEAVLPHNEKTGIVIISAHLDSTAEGDPAFHPLIDPAPGADDDASGVAAVLLAARAITRLANKYDKKQRREIRFVLFNAEEAQQSGSRHYASMNHTKVKGVFQLDMLGYASKQNVFEIHAGYEPPSNSSASDVQTRSLKLAEYVEILAHDVSPGLKAEIFPLSGKRDPAQGFSDHTSFHHMDVPACLVTENFFCKPDEVDMDPQPRGEPNPAHHLPEDRPDKLDYIYAANIARAVTAAAWYLATRDTSPRPAASDVATAAAAATVYPLADEDTAPAHNHVSDT